VCTFAGLLHLLHLNYSINLRSILLLIAMLQGLVIAGLLLARGLRRRQVADFLLAALLFFLACSLISHFIGFMGVYDYAREHGFDLTYFPFDNAFFFGPLILLYTRALTDGQFQWKQRDMLHFVLPLLNYVVHFAVWALPYDQKMAVLNGPVTKVLLYIVPDVVCYLLTVWYLWQSFRRLRTYRALIEQEYANTGLMTLEWLQIFLVGFSAYLAFDILFSIVALVYNFWYTGWYWLVLLRAAVLYYLSTAGWAYTQKSMVQYDLLEERAIVTGQSLPDQSPAAAAASITKSALSDAELAPRRAQLTAFMDETRPWLDPELTLSDLARQVGLNASQLSYLVNQSMGQNFNDFVNTYRVAEVKRKLSTPDFQHLSLLGIAFESGFNSKATFNRAFKKLTGQAPSQHR
jgi:AraC-like DNA-binding protein